MSTVAVPPVESKPLSEPERLINTFVAPSKTFTDIRRNPSWWVPTVILAIIAFAVSMVMARKVDFSDVVRESIQNSPRASQFEQMSPEQRERAYEQGAAVAKFMVYLSFLFPIVAVVLFAAVLMGIFNFGFGTTLDYKHALAITAYGQLPGVVTAVLLVIVLMTVDISTFNLQNPLATNPAYFFDPSNAQHYWYRLLQKFDVIRIWSIGLMALGVAKNSKLKLGTTFATGIGIFVLLSLIFSLLG